MKSFIESNRQTGSTTALVKAVIETNGILVVGNLGTKSAILKNHRELKDSNVVTCGQIDRGLLKGIKRPAAIFFDATAILEIINREGMNVEDLQKLKREIALGQIDRPLNVIKISGNPTAEDLNTWRGVFEDASKDPDFKIFTHEAVEIETIKPDHKRQLNVKMTEDDAKAMEEINKDFFEGEATNSMLGRIILRKGMAFYKKLKTML
jgi:hypothetical protein